MIKWRPLQGDPTIQLLYQGTENARTTQEELLIHETKQTEHKVASLSHAAEEHFSGHFSSSNSRDNVECLACAYSVLGGKSLLM